MKRLNVVNLIKKTVVPDSKIDTSEKITVWEVEGQGNNNNFPQQLLQNVYNSPAGSAAIDLWHQFVEGAGLADDSVGKVKVNTTQTLNDLHGKISADTSSMWGFSVQVTYNNAGERKSFQHLPFESARLGALNDKGITDRVYFNPYYGTADYDKRFTTWFYSYNPDPTFVKDQIAQHNKLRAEKKVDFLYPGQVYWFSIERPLARIYPQPFYFSAISWFQVDAAIQKFHSRNIDNNFLLSLLINKFGNPDVKAGEEDDEGNQISTVGEEFNKDMSDFAGAENAGAVLVNWFQKEEEKATIEEFPNNVNDNLFATLQTLVSDQIAIGTKSPRILINIATSGKLGDAEEILNAVQVMNGNTSRMRSILSSEYLKLFNGYKNFNEETDFTIAKLNPFNILPSWVVESLNTQQRNKYIAENFNIDFEEPTKQKKTTDDPAQAAAQAQLKGSVGGVQGILSIQQGVSAGLTTRESALEVLQLIYGFTEDEANRLLGNPKEEAEQTTEEQNITNKLMNGIK